MAETTDPKTDSPNDCAPLEGVVRQRYLGFSPLARSAGMVARCERLQLLGERASSFALEIIGRWGGGMESSPGVDLPFREGIRRKPAVTGAKSPALAETPGGRPGVTDSAPAVAGELQVPAGYAEPFPGGGEAVAAAVPPVIKHPGGGGVEKVPAGRWESATRKGAASDGRYRRGAATEPEPVQGADAVPLAAGTSHPPTAGVVTKLTAADRPVAANGGGVVHGVRLKRAVTGTTALPGTGGGNRTEGCAGTLRSPVTSKGTPPAESYGGESRRAEGGEMVPDLPGLPVVRELAKGEKIAAAGSFSGGAVTAARAPAGKGESASGALAASAVRLHDSGSRCLLRRLPPAHADGGPSVMAEAAWGTAASHRTEPFPAPAMPLSTVTVPDMRGGAEAAASLHLQRRIADPSDAGTARRLPVVAVAPPRSEVAATATAGVYRTPNRSNPVNGEVGIVFSGDQATPRYSEPQGGGRPLRPKAVGSRGLLRVAAGGGEMPMPALRLAHSGDSVHTDQLRRPVAEERAEYSRALQRAAEPRSGGAAPSAPLSPVPAALPAPGAGYAADERQSLAGMAPADLERLADRVYAMIEQRLTIEKERRGL